MGDTQPVVAEPLYIIHNSLDNETIVYPGWPRLSCRVANEALLEGTKLRFGNRRDLPPGGAHDWEISSVNDQHKLAFNRVGGVSLDLSVKGPMRFLTGDPTQNPSEKLRILANGNVGVGTANPAQKLHIAGSFITVDGAGNEQCYIGGDGGGGDVQFGSLNGGVSKASIWNQATASLMDLAARDIFARNLSVTGQLNIGAVGGLSISAGGITAGGGFDIFSGTSGNGRIMLRSANGVLVVNDFTVIGIFGTRLKANLNCDVSITGNLTKPGGSFQIDHPLDPANKYLCHSFVESPDMKNVYDGVVVMDTKGVATVKLPDWFDALNDDFRYQLTAMGAPAPNLHVVEEITGNRFKIAGGVPGTRVSWQVTGIRRDAWAKAHRVKVEEEKPTAERGFYLHPHLYNQPVEKDIALARYQGQISPIPEQIPPIKKKRK